MRTFVIGLFLIAVSGFAVAQKNELSITLDGVLASDQTQIFNPPMGCPFETFPPNCLIFSNKLQGSFTFALNAEYARRIVHSAFADFYLEAPFFVIPSHLVGFIQTANMPINGAVLRTRANTSLFITPALRVQVFTGSSVSPFASLGGGYARYGPIVSGPNVNTGALQFGGGVDFKSFARYLKFRVEIRDVFTGSRIDASAGPPQSLNPTHLHNVFIGGGLVLR